MLLPFNRVKDNIGILFLLCLIPGPISEVIRDKLCEQETDMVTRGSQSGVQGAWDHHLYHGGSGVFTFLGILKLKIHEIILMLFYC